MKPFSWSIGKKLQQNKIIKYKRATFKLITCALLHISCNIFTYSVHKKNREKSL